MALAGLAAVAGLSFWVSTWPEWLRTTTSPLGAAACARWRADAEAADKKRTGWFEVYEGFAHLQGVCLPKDEARGRALIERAMALRINDRIVIDYVTALRAVGDEQRAQEWAPHATQVVIHRKGMWAWIDTLRRPRTGFDPIEYGFLTLQGDLPGTRLRIERLLAREPVFPDLEAEALERWLGRLMVWAEGDYKFLSYRATRAGRYEPKKWESELSLLEGAAYCGHPDAIRTLATRFALEDSFHTRFLWLAGAVASLHRTTGQEAELLNLVLARQNRTIDDVHRRGEITRFERSRDLSCGAGRGAANRSDN